MANLKELRNKIGVVQSTRKVTSAMKLVAAVKLKKAEQKAYVSKEYAIELESVFSKIHRRFLDIGYELFSGRERVNTEMLIMMASDRGLCGNFNYVIGKEVAEIISEFHRNNKKVYVVCAGSKLFEPIKRLLSKDDPVELLKDFYRNEDLFSNSQKLAQKAIDYFESGKVDRISITCMRYYSAMRHKVEVKTIVPMQVKTNNADNTVTIFEPNIKQIFKTALPYNVTVQIYQAALESIASEQGSRMISMDNATKNADELISGLTLKYNRNRQYNITQELAEIVSGAEAISKG
jgi:F-type H+-transporting ATPase subunit gamma